MIEAWLGDLQPHVFQTPICYKNLLSRQSLSFAPSLLLHHFLFFHRH
jgi:hypothetical protein